MEGDELQLGKILELIPSADGELRSAKIKFKGREVIHSLKNLRLIESTYDKGRKGQGFAGTLRGGMPDKCTKTDSNDRQPPVNPNIRSTSPADGHATLQDPVNKSNTPVTSARPPRIAAQKARHNWNKQT